MKRMNEQDKVDGEYKIYEDRERGGSQQGSGLTSLRWEFSF
jgi:hypothetical protein